MKSNNRIRVALIGCGQWGLNILHELLKLNSIEIVGCVDLSQVALDNLRRKYPNISLFSKTSELYMSKILDAVIIATPNNTHFPFALEGLTKGMHIWIEKPALTNKQEFNELIALSMELDKIVFCDHIYQYDMGIRRLIAETKHTFFGKPYLLRSIRTNYGTFQSNDSVVKDLALHDLTIAYQLFCTQPIAISANASSINKQYLSDTAFMHIQYRDNQHVYSMISWQAPQKTRHIELVGSKGMIEYIENGQNRIINSYAIKQGSISKMNSTILTVPCSSLHNALDHFVYCIQHHKQPITDLKCALSMHELIQIIEESISNDGKTIIV